MSKASIVLSATNTSFTAAFDRFLSGELLHSVDDDGEDDGLSFRFWGMKIFRLKI